MNCLIREAQIAEVETHQKSQGWIVRLRLLRFLQRSKLVDVVLRCSIKMRVVDDDDAPVLHRELLHRRLGGENGLVVFAGRKQRLAEHHQQQAVLATIRRGPAPVFDGRRVVTSFERALPLIDQFASACRQAFTRQRRQRRGCGWKRYSRIGRRGGHSVADADSDSWNGDRIEAIAVIREVPAIAAARSITMRSGYETCAAPAAPAAPMPRGRPATDGMASPAAEMSTTAARMSAAGMSSATAVPATAPLAERHCGQAQ